MEWFIQFFDGIILKHLLGVLLLVIPFCITLGLIEWALGRYEIDHSKDPFKATDEEIVFEIWKEFLKLFAGGSAIFLYVILVVYLLQ